MHGDIPPRLRERNFERFKKRDEGTQVLVCTDLASRGLDLPHVSHVINFDFPRTNADYLHRAGRAGRAGRPGFVTSLYRERNQPLLEAMKTSQENLTPLEIEGGSAYSIRKQVDGAERKDVNLGSKIDHAR